MVSREGSIASRLLILFQRNILRRLTSIWNDVACNPYGAASNKLKRPISRCDLMKNTMGYVGSTL